MQIPSILILIVSLLLLGQPAAAAQTPLVVSGNPEAPPIVWKHRDTLTGVGPALVNTILDQLAVPYTYRIIKSWQEVQEQAAAGKVDLIVSAYRNKTREQYLRFSEPYLKSPVVIVVPRGRTFPCPGWAGLKGKKGAAHTGESFGEKFDRYIKEELSVRYGSYEQIFQLLNQGLVDYLIMDLYPALIYAKLLQAEDKVEFIDTPVTVQQFHLAVARTSPYVSLLPAINEKIRQMKKEGKIKAMVKEQYLSWHQTFLQRQKFFAQQYNRAEEQQQEWNAGARDRGLETLSRFIEENRPYMTGSSTFGTY